MQEPIIDHQPQPKRPLIKFKHVIAFFLFSWIILVFGSFWKMMSWPGAGEAIIIGAALQLLSILAIAIKILSYQNPDSFLNK